MRKTVLALAIAAVFAPSFAMAEAGDFVVRLRATHINPSEDSSLGKYTNQNVGPVLSQGAELKVDSNTIPEIDFSYYITKNIAVELILATGTKHDVSITKAAGSTLGNQNLGEVNLLPPTLTVQWHFMPDQMFDPYVGVGLNVTKFMDNSLATTKGIPGLPIRVDHWSVGPAIQAGFDVNLKDGWLINADIKKAWIDTDVEINAGAGYRKIDELDIDPWVFSLGVGKKF
ncbi:MAG: outer membrane beta-barrel protein [Methylophilaceae bacterium]|nr:outer membrane beta-barrel protein [Methylophilaceae bacterium]